jgi:hypothetical protein
MKKTGRLNEDTMTEKSDLKSAKYKSTFKKTGP